MDIHQVLGKNLATGGVSINGLNLFDSEGPIPFNLDLSITLNKLKYVYKSKLKHLKRYHMHVSLNFYVCCCTTVKLPIP